MFSTGREIGREGFRAPGRHLLVELYGCSSQHLTNADRVRAVLNHVAASANVHVIDTVLKTFDGGGITCVLVLAESHLSIHTWPEHAYAAVDMFTCGTGMLDQVVQLLEDGFGATRQSHQTIMRGGGLNLSPTRAAADNIGDRSQLEEIEHDSGAAL